MECPICKSSYNKLVTSRKNISPYQNKLFATYTEACNIKRVNLDMYICENCAFVYNPQFDINIELYDDDYNNDQNASSIFEKYVEESIDHIIHNYVKEKSNILEIGCGKYGTYLKKLTKKIGNSCSGIGYDPAYTGKLKFENNVNFVKDLYDFSQNRNKKFDLIISRHVIEHIVKPLDMFKNIENIINNSDNATAFIETPDVTWILENNAWFDFCYEHCSFFSSSSLEMAVEKNGLGLIELRNAFNGQYMQAFLKIQTNQKYNDSFKYNVEKLNKLALNYSLKEKEKIQQYLDCLKKITKQGITAIWGAGAKGNTFLNILDKDRKFISAVIDINLNKKGKFIAGTGHEIIAPNQINELGIKNIIIMNSNYCNEIKNILNNEKINLDEIKLLKIEDL